MDVNYADTTLNVYSMKSLKSAMIAIKCSQILSALKDISKLKFVNILKFMNYVKRDIQKRVEKTFAVNWNVKSAPNTTPNITIFTALII